MLEATLVADKKMTTETVALEFGLDSDQCIGL